MEDHLSTVNRPLLRINPTHIAPGPLRLTFGITLYILWLGIESEYSYNGLPLANVYAQNLAHLLRDGIGVQPAPYWGGSFEGRACHKIGRAIGTHELAALEVRTGGRLDKVQRGVGRVAGGAPCLEPDKCRVDQQSCGVSARHRPIRGRDDRSVPLVICHSQTPCAVLQRSRLWSSLGASADIVSKAWNRGMRIVTKMLRCTMSTHSWPAAWRTCGSHPSEAHPVRRTRTAACGAFPLGRVLERARPHDRMTSGLSPGGPWRGARAKNLVPVRQSERRTASNGRLTVWARRSGVLTPVVGGLVGNCPSYPFQPRTDGQTTTIGLTPTRRQRRPARFRWGGRRVRDGW